MLSYFISTMKKIHTKLLHFTIKKLSNRASCENVPSTSSTSHISESINCHFTDQFFKLHRFPRRHSCVEALKVPNIPLSECDGKTYLCYSVSAYSRYSTSTMYAYTFNSKNGSWIKITNVNIDMRWNILERFVNCLTKIFREELLLLFNLFFSFLHCDVCIKYFKMMMTKAYEWGWGNK